MHVNFSNEGHPAELLESFSVSTTLPVGKLLPGVNLTRTPKNTICSPPTTSHLSQGCHWEIQSQSQEPCKICEILCGMLSKLESSETELSGLTLTQNTAFYSLSLVSLSDVWPIGVKRNPWDTQVVIKQVFNNQLLFSKRSNLNILVELCFWSRDVLGLLSVQSEQ